MFFELFTTKPPQTPLQIMWCYELLSEEEYYKLCETLSRQLKNETWCLVNSASNATQQVFPFLVLYTKFIYFLHFMESNCRNTINIE